MAALQDAYLSLIRILELRLGPRTREQLELLRDRVARVARRDDGHR